MTEPNSYKLGIKNFQSIREADLEIEGLTVLFGVRSDIGKSSVVRALRCLITGRFITGAVTTGADACQIKLDWDDHSIVWRKGERVNDYMIDGKLYHKVGATSPEDVAQLGLRKVIYGGDTPILLQVRGQFQKGWPLACSPPELGKILSRMIQTERVFVAAKSVLSDIRELGQERVSLARQLEETKTRQKLFEPLAVLKDMVKKCNWENLNCRKLQLEQARKLVDDLNKIEKDIAIATTAKKKAEDKIVDLKDLDKLATIYELTLQLTGINKKLAMPRPVFVAAPVAIGRAIELGKEFALCENDRVSAEDRIYALQDELAEVQKELTRIGKICDKCEGRGILFNEQEKEKAEGSQGKLKEAKRKKKAPIKPKKQTKA